MNLALSGLSTDLRRQVEDVMRSYILVEMGIRRVTARVEELNGRRAVIEPSQLGELTLELRGIKEQQDLANSKLKALVDACKARTDDDETTAVLQGLFSAFVEGVGEADRAIQRTIAEAARRHGIRRP